MGTHQRGRYRSGTHCSIGGSGDGKPFPVVPSSARVRNRAWPTRAEPPAPDPGPSPENTGTTEAVSRVKIDALLKDAGWNLTNGTSVLFEHALGDGSPAGYVLCDRSGWPMAVVEAKRASIEPIAAQDQGHHCAEQREVPFIFLSNGEEVWFLDPGADAHARAIATFYSQEAFERRGEARADRRALSDVPIDRRLVDRDSQIDCVETISRKVRRNPFGIELNPIEQ